MSRPRPPRMLTTSEAAAQLGIARNTLARYVARGLIQPTVTLPTGHMRWDMDDLRAQLRRVREQRQQDDDG